MSNDWQAKLDYFAQEAVDGWLPEYFIKPDRPFALEHPVFNPVRVNAGEPLSNFLVRNDWAKPHDLRLIFLNDYQQLPVHVGNSHQLFYDLPVMAPQEQLGFRFTLSALPAGFHQFSFLMITDPTSISPDATYRALQKHSFNELRYDIWVGTENLPTVVPSFDTFQEGAPLSNLVTDLEVITQPETVYNEALAQLTMPPGETRSLTIRFFNCGPKCTAQIFPNEQLPDQSFPLLLSTFWNDQNTRTSQMDFSFTSPDDLTITIQIQAPQEAGDYQLMVVGFPLPGYSEFTNQAERSLGVEAIWSRRILVNVRK